MACDKSCKLSRRGICQACIAGMSVASVAMVGFPVISFMGMPIRVTNDKPVEVPLDQLTPGQAVYAALRGQQIIILKTTDGESHVLSTACPHLGCNVTWETADAVFRCPCHGAVFDAAGQIVSGPVSSPLKKIPFEIKDGIIIVT